MYMFAINCAYLSEPPTRIPLLEAVPEVETNENGKEVTRHNQFQIKFRNPFTDEYGKVESYSVIVTKNSEDSHLRDGYLPYWAALQETESLFTYVAIEKCETLFEGEASCGRNERVKRDTGAKAADGPTEVKITVGGNVDCDVEKKNVSCNGPLSSSTTYYVKLRAYTDGDKFKDTPLSAPITTGRFILVVTWNLVCIFCK